MRIFSVAIKNIMQRPARSAAILLGLAAISWMLFTLTFIHFSLAESIRRGVSRLGADAMVVPAEWQADTRGVLLSGGPISVYMESSIVEKVKEIEGVQAATGQLFIVSARLSCCSVSDTMLVGFDPEGDFTITPWLRKELPAPLRDDEVVVGANILNEPDGRIQFYGKLFTIAGKLDPTGVDYIDGAVFIPMAGARQMIDKSPTQAEVPLEIKADQISAALLKFKQGVNHEEAALKVEYSLPGKKVILTGDMVRDAKRNLAVPLRTAMVAGALQWLISIVLIGALYGLSVSERVQDIGLMRAMGAKAATVLRMFLFEVAVLSGAGGFLGALGGVVLVFLFRKLLWRVFDMQFAFISPSGIAALVLLTVAFTLLTGLAATAYPILRGSRFMPSEIIRKNL